MQKSPALKLSLSFANFLMAPMLASGAIAAPVNGTAAEIVLPKPAALPATSTKTTNTSRKMAGHSLPQTTLQREGASTVVSLTQRTDVQKASTRIALQSSLPTAMPRAMAPRVVKTQKLARVPVARSVTPQKIVSTTIDVKTIETKTVETKLASPTLSSAPAVKTVSTTKVVVDKAADVSLPNTRVQNTRVAALPKTEIKAVEKSAPPVLRRAQPTVLASRSRTSAPAMDDERVLLAQLERELRNSKRDLIRANAKLSEGQRELQKFNGVLRQAMLEAGDDAKGLHPFVRVAQRYAGTPYVWGGESARGFDCSGFIIRVMRDLGYKAPPHSAALQFNYGMPVAQALLKPGDLVFFANTYKPGISHVGIYLGKRRFIHAAGTGLGTIVSNLDHPKYQAKYAGGRRLVNVR